MILLTVHPAYNKLVMKTDETKINVRQLTFWAFYFCTLHFLPMLCDAFKSKITVDNHLLNQK